MGEGVTLDRKAYEEIIEADIKALHECMPINSLEKRHIINVLRWSVEREYPQNYVDIQQDMTNSIDLMNDSELHTTTEEDLFWFINDKEINDLSND